MQKSLGSGKRFNKNNGAAEVVTIFKSIGLSERFAFTGLIVLSAGFILLIFGTWKVGDVMTASGGILFVIGLYGMLSVQFFKYNTKSHRFMVQRDFLLFKRGVWRSMLDYQYISVTSERTRADNVTARGISPRWHGGIYELYNIYLIPLDPFKEPLFIAQFSEWDKTHGILQQMAHVSGLGVDVNIPRANKRRRRKMKKAR